MPTVCGPIFSTLQHSADQLDSLETLSAAFLPQRLMMAGSMTDYIMVARSQPPCK